MAIVTLISDIGSESVGLSRFVHRFNQHLGQHRLHIISADIAPFDIAEAAFVFDSVVEDFPKETLHLVDVEADVNRFGNLLLGKINEQSVLCANNGFFTLLSHKYQNCLIEKGEYSSKAGTFALLNSFLPLAEPVLNGNPASAFDKAEHILERASLQPVIEEKQVRGTVVYVDNFGNATTNITRELLDKTAQGRKFNVRLNRHEKNDHINTFYSSVDEGEKLCLWTESGHLQVAINHGDASKLLGLQKGRMITIEFE